MIGKVQINNLTMSGSHCVHEWQTLTLATRPSVDWEQFTGWPPQMYCHMEEAIHEACD